MRCRAAMDDLSLLRLLDSCHKDEVEEVHDIVSAGLEARRSPWVVNTLVDYYFRYGSFEALSLLKTLPEIQAQVGLYVSSGWRSESDRFTARTQLI